MKLIFIARIFVLHAFQQTNWEEEIVFLRIIFPFKPLRDTVGRRVLPSAYSRHNLHHSDYHPFL